MMVLLTNPRKESFTFTLYHNVYCVNGGKCDCQKDSILRPVSGGLRYDEVINPIGVFLEEGDTREFDEAVLKIQQVAAAISTGRLKKSVMPEKPASVEVADKVEIVNLVKEKVQKA